MLRYLCGEERQNEPSTNLPRDEEDNAKVRSEAVKYALVLSSSLLKKS
jgi:hypothetical protein